jgi:enamine deaminase RidA (YjgF/YER057c/UK114 family)
VPVGATFSDMVQINLYLLDLLDFVKASAVFYECFDKGGFPAMMTLASEFIYQTWEIRV